MLSKITIQGLFNEIDYDLTLNKGPLTYIHAQNGHGKSTIMKLVSDVLDGNFEEVRTVSFQKLILYFDNGNRLIITNNDQELSTVMDRASMEEEVSSDDIVGLLNTTYIGPERLYIFGSDGGIVPSVDMYMKELADNIGKAIRDSEIAVGRGDAKSYTDSDLDQLFKNEEAKIDYIKQAGFGPSVPAGYRFPPSRYEIGERKSEYVSMAESIRDYAEHYYQFAESIVVFKDILNTFYVNKTVEINNKGFLQAKMDKSGTIIPIAKLSSGEKQIIIMFYLLLFKTAPGSLVIIDEPEVSLHVSWQQELGKFIKDIAKIRDLQVIVSTHAPAVIHDDWDLAVELGKPKGE